MGKKVLLNILKGGALGALTFVGLFIIGILVEVANLGCAILTCDCDRNFVFDWNMGNLANLLLLCVLAGAIVGLCYGFFKAKQDDSQEALRKKAILAEERRKQQVKWASEVKKKALDVNSACSNNKIYDKPLVSATYKSSSQMSEIVKELAKAAEKQGKIDSLAEEISQKGGVSV